MVNTMLTETELGKHQASLQGFFFFLSSHAVSLQAAMFVCWLVLAQLVIYFKSPEVFINLSYLTRICGKHRNNQLH